MTVGSLFSGIGGFDLGLERAGMVIKWQVEIDDFCNKVLEKHWPNVNRYRDIKELRGDELEPVDLICGGFPCQPFSAAGKRRSKEDDRYLWPEMLRVIRAVRPNWIIGENVAGIVSLALDDVLSDLENEGYACQSFIIPACAVNAPHRRDRVWIIARRNSERQLQQKGTLEEQRRRVSNSNKQNAADPASTGTGLDERGLWRLFEQTNQPDSSSDTACESGKSQLQRESGEEKEGKSERGSLGNAVTDPYHSGLQTEGTEQQAAGAFEHGIMAGGLTDTERWDSSWIPVAADFCRVDDGVSAGMDRPGRKNYRAKRLKALGNAVVPQIVEAIGRAIIETEKG